MWLFCCVFGDNHVPEKPLADTFLCSANDVMLHLGRLQGSTIPVATFRKPDLSRVGYQSPL